MKDVRVTKDHRRIDGTGWQSGEWQGFAVHREWARTVISYNSETGDLRLSEKAKPGPWRFNVTGFTDRADWPSHPTYDCNVGHVERVDGSTVPVRMYGRKLFVTPRGTEAWSH